MFGAGPIDGPIPLAEIKSERERTKTNDSGRINKAGKEGSAY